MKRCLCDLDGVFADFVGGACRAFGRKNPYDDRTNHGVYRLEYLLQLSPEQFFGSMGEEFWANLEPTQEFDEILRLVEDAFGQENVCLLTAPVKTKGCCDGKSEWLQKHLPYYFKERQYLIGKAKHFCAGPQSVLLDDDDGNVNKFRKAGGNAILLARPWNSRYREETMPALHADLNALMRVRSLSLLR